VRLVLDMAMAVTDYGKGMVPGCVGGIYRMWGAGYSFLKGNFNQLPPFFLAYLICSCSIILVLFPPVSVFSLFLHGIGTGWRHFINLHCICGRIYLSLRFSFFFLFFCFLVLDSN